MWCKHAKKNRNIREDKIQKGINSLPRHCLLGRCWVICVSYWQEVALLRWISFWEHQHVCVVGLRYLGGTICRNLPSNVNKMSWRLDSCQLHPIAQGPKLCLSARRYALIFLWLGPGGLFLQLIVIHWQSCLLWGISKCHIYWRTHPWVLNLIDLVVWLLERCNEQLRLGICHDDCRRPSR